MRRLLAPVTGPAAKRSLIAGRDALAWRVAATRVAARPARLRPAFVIAGVQKGGTTFLYQELTRHPDVVPALTKEIHHFDDRYHQGRRAYPGFFPASPPAGAITGEASPGYVFHPRAIARLAADLPGVRVIVLLRDPVERARSHHQHEVRLGFEPLARFEEALASEDGRLDGEWERMAADEHYASFAWRHFSYRSRGHYVDQLRRLHEHVPPERVCVLFSEALYAEPRTALAEVHDFLGLAPHDGEPGGNDMAAPRRPLDPAVEACLRAHYRPGNEALAAYLGRDPGWPA